MRSCSPEEILAAFPDAQSFSVPNEFFDSLPTNVDVFSSLYQWMIDTRRVRTDKTRHLPDRTFVGERLAKKLRAAEKRRIARYAHVHGKELESALAWSDLNTGPRTEFAHCRIRGDLVIVLPADTDAINAVRSKWWWERYNKRLASIKNRASGSNFYEWLVASCDRDDPIGDFARDTMDDRDFPQEVDHYVGIRTYLENHNASDSCLSTTGEAWLEYVAKYPDRIKRRVLCSECGEEIQDINSGLIAWTERGNFFEIVHMNCRDERTRWQIQLDAIKLAESLRDFFHKNTIPSQIVDALEVQLSLAGFLLTPPPKSLVYFIESQPSGSIKIGYSGSLRQAEQRRKALQIARHPEILRIKAVIDGDLKFEAGLQRRFEAHNLGGEWFSPHPGLLEFIAANAYDPYDKQ